MIHASRRQSLRLGAGAAALALGAPCVVRAQASTKWDLSTVLAEGHVHTVNARRFAREVAAATGGAVEIAVRSGGHLGFKEPAHLQAVREGLVTMANMHNVEQAGDEPLFDAESLPFLVSTPDELKTLHKHLRPIYEQAAAANNQKILCMVPWPGQCLLLKSKADRLDGLKGIKTRVADKDTQDMLAALGMAPAVIPWNDTNAALASGAVAGVSTAARSGVDGKLWALLKVVLLTRHVWSSQMLNVNLDAWNRLKPQHRTAIEGLARMLEPDFWKASMAHDEESLATLKANGMEIVSVPPQMMKDCQARTAPLRDAFLKRVPAADKPVRAYLAERA